MEKIDNYTHYSVLLNESINLLNIKSDGVYVDCTLGGGGHSEAILKHLTTGHLYAFDQDEYACKKAMARLSAYADKLTIINDNFSNILNALEEFNIKKVDGIIYDLGVSSFQLDIPERGFSYRFDAPLDMRMNQEASLSAYEVVNNYSYADLKRILYEYGEESFAPLIAKHIVTTREVKPIATTLELVEVIKAALPAAILRKAGHPAKKTFQAIRIEVNQELAVLEDSLHQSLKLLNGDGRVVVITFQSLEDKIVKRIFKEATTLNLPKGLPYIPDGYHIDYELINTKVILPSSAEIDENLRSHSAKLRGIRKK
jgi:16S rRNA (cytosine1402-N4)-methyltransferase